MDIAKQIFAALEKGWNIEKTTDSFIYNVSFLPDSGPYAGGVFFADLTFPNCYPYYPPKLRMTTRIFHPNFSNVPGHEGNMYVDFLHEGWSPLMTVSKILNRTLDLFQNPDLDAVSVCNKTAGNMYTNDPENFFRNAKEWTKSYAF